ncbi:MAG: lipocalin-like domain-containing protein [Bacteroidota bacterium]
MNKNSLPTPTKGLASGILGIWKLKSREDVDDKGQLRIDPFLGKDPLGILCFAPDYFSAQFMKRDRSAPESMIRSVQGSNNSSAVNGYDAYFGSYKVDEVAGTLTVHLDGSISPGNVGNTYIRDVRIIEDQLIIQLATTSIDGAVVTRTLTLSRIG